MPLDAETLVRKRLDTQGLSRARFRSPVEVVRWFGAVQSQDYAGSKWAVGQRLKRVSDRDLDRAFDAGEILRTHVLRPTWHFVLPEDLRWMLALTAPRIHRFNGYGYRKYEIDRQTVTRSRKAMEGALEKGGHLTREELGAAMRRARIQFDGIRLAHLVMHAELDAAICSGPRRGRQFTYALTDQRVPRARTLERDDALAALTRRYLTGHGPATARDFSWWSGLSMSDARRGLDMLGGAIERQSIGNLTYWSVPSELGPRPRVPLVHLLPSYDECLVAFKDRDVPAALAMPPKAKRHGNFPHQLVIAGRVSGGWRRAVGTRRIEVDVLPYRPLTRAERQSLDLAIESYARFMGLPATLRVLS